MLPTPALELIVEKLHSSPNSLWHLLHTSRLFRAATLDGLNSTLLEDHCVRALVRLHRGHPRPSTSRYSQYSALLSCLMGMTCSKYDFFSRGEQLLCLYQALQLKRTIGSACQCIHDMIECAVRRHDLSLVPKLQMRARIYDQLMTEALRQGIQETVISRTFEMGDKAYERVWGKAPDPKDAELVASQTRMSPFVSLLAIFTDAIFTEDGDIVNAIMLLVE